MAGKFSRYTEEMGLNMGEFFNRTIRSTLNKGIQEASRATKHDSSRAAFHWIIIPDSGGSPGARKFSRYHPEIHGKAPVGLPGDRGINRAQVIKAVTDREHRAVINRAVRGRNPVVKFAFFNPVPDEHDEDSWLTSGGQESQSNSYRENAEIEKAMRNAYFVMATEFERQLLAGNVRKNPIR